MEEEDGTQCSLRSAENLSLPQVQVVVMSANMGCCHCRERVSKLVSQINSLLDYVVDLRKREVTVRGVVEKNKRKAHKGRISSNKKSPTFLAFFGLRHCFGAL